VHHISSSGRAAYAERQAVMVQQDIWVTTSLDSMTSVSSARIRYPFETETHVFEPHGCRISFTGSPISHTSLTASISDAWHGCDSDLTHWLPTELN